MARKRRPATATPEGVLDLFGGGMEAPPTPKRILSAPPPPSQTDSPDSGAVVLRRVQVNPVLLSRALVLATAFQAEYAESRSQAETLRIFVRDSDLLIVADVGDVEGDSSRDMRFRFSVPLTGELNDGTAEWVGVVVRGTELLEALRNRVENSERYGILSAKQPVTLTAVSTENRARASEILITPKSAGTGRRVRVLNGADLATVSDADPVVADENVAGFPAEALIEAAGATHPAVGILVDPSVTDDRGVIAGVGPHGAMLATFQSPASGQTSLLDVASSRQGKRNRLDRPMVLSSRMATAAGQSQLAMEESLRAHARLQLANYQAAIAVAAITAVGAVAGSRHAEPVLFKAVGLPVVRQASSSVRDEGVPSAVAFARLTLNLLGDDDRATVARQVAHLHSNEPLSEVLQDDLRLHSEGDAAVAGVARLALLEGGLTIECMDVLSTAVGRAIVRGTTREMLGRSRSASVVVSPTFADYAWGAVRAVRDKWKELADAMLAGGLLSSAQFGAWARQFEVQLADWGMPQEIGPAVVAQAKDMGPVGHASIVIPDDVARRRLKEAPASAHGRLWRDDDGRVFTGLGTEDGGILFLSDRADNPLPEAFPLDRITLHDALVRGTAFPWSATVFAGDLDSAAGRIVGLQRPDQVSPWHSSTTLQPGETLFVARWTPADGDEPAAGSVMRHWPRGAERSPVHIDTVYLGDGSDLTPMRIARHVKEREADPLEAGELRVFGFSRTGERLHFTLPMRSPPRSSRGSRSVAFALDANQLHDFIAFVTRKDAQKGVAILWDAAPGGVRVSTSDGSRVAVIPTLTATQVPDELAVLVAAAGVPLTAEEVPIAAIAARLRTVPIQGAESHEGPLIAGDEVEGIAWREEEVEPVPSRPTPRVVLPSARQRVESEIAQGIAREVIGARLGRELNDAYARLAALEKPDVVQQASLFGPLDGASTEAVPVKGLARRVAALKRRIAELTEARSAILALGESTDELGTIRPEVLESRLVDEDDDVEQVDAQQDLVSQEVQGTSVTQTSSDSLARMKRVLEEREPAHPTNVSPKVHSRTR